MMVLLNSSLGILTKIITLRVDRLRCFSYIADFMIHECILAILFQQNLSNDNFSPYY